MGVLDIEREGETVDGGGKVAFIIEESINERGGWEGVEIVRDDKGERGTWWVVEGRFWIPKGEEGETGEEKGFERVLQSEKGLESEVRSSELNLELSAWNTSFKPGRELGGGKPPTPRPPPPPPERGALPPKDPGIDRGLGAREKPKLEVNPLPPGRRGSVRGSSVLISLRSSELAWVCVEMSLMVGVKMEVGEGVGLEVEARLVGEGEVKGEVKGEGLMLSRI